MREDPLAKYQFHVKISEEDVRDGDANPWERVVAGLAAEVRIQNDTIRELRERVAELEPSAKLGRVVREMPEGALLQHCRYTTGRSDWAYLEPRPKWGGRSSCERHADMPAEAIEAVRRKR